MWEEQAPVGSLLKFTAKWPASVQRIKLQNTPFSQLAGSWKQRTETSWTQSMSFSKKSRDDKHQSSPVNSTLGRFFSLSLSICSYLSAPPPPPLCISLPKWLYHLKCLAYILGLEWGLVSAMRLVTANEVEWLYQILWKRQGAICLSLCMCSAVCVCVYVCVYLCMCACIREPIGKLSIEPHYKNYSIYIQQLLLIKVSWKLSQTFSVHHGI